MGFWRTLGVALYLPFFALAFGLVWLACAFDRLLPLPLPFPRNPAQLAKRRDWCIAQLRKANAVPADATIDRYDVRALKQSEVFRSAIARVTVDYTHNGQAHTFACIAKFTIEAGSLGTMAVSIIQANARNEVNFYLEQQRAVGAAGTFARDHGLKVYYARVGGVAMNFLVMLEEVQGVVEYSEDEGAPMPQARAVARMYARFHAAHWRHDPKARLPKVPVRIPPFAIDFMCSLAFGKKHRVLRHGARVSWHYANRVQTIVHGDARVGNVLFRNGTEPVLIDWQSPHWGIGAYDLAYFITLSLSSSDREAYETELLRMYHDELVANGVRDYDYAALYQDYLHSLTLLGSILVVPLLGGEVTVNADNLARVVSGGLVWEQRVRHMLDRFDTDWLEAQYGIDAETLRETVEWTSRHPPFLNRGAVLVAKAAAERAAAARRD